MFVGRKISCCIGLVSEPHYLLLKSNMAFLFVDEKLI